jgi:hydrogenase maturation factor
VASVLWVFALEANIGLVVDEARLHVIDACRTLCRHFGLDPLGVIASGSLLISAAKDRAGAIVKRLAAEAIDAAVIGEVVSAEQGCQLRSGDGMLRPLPEFPRDETARLFDRSMGE